MAPSSLEPKPRSARSGFVMSLFKNTNRKSQNLECPTNPELYRKHIIELLSIEASEEVMDLTAHLSKGDFIYSGGYGEVYKGSWIGPALKVSQGSLPQVAVKVMRVAQLDDGEVKAKRIKQLRRELRVWQALQHRNILPLVATVCLDGNPNLPAIVSPWMENGALLQQLPPLCLTDLKGTVMQYITKNPTVSRENLMLNVIEALEYLHTSEPQIIHGDMKAANVLVDHRGNLYIADFGLSRMLDAGTLWNTSATHAVGTTRWTAPELLKGDQSTVTTASDMYAFAMTCYEILSGELPFLSLRNDAAVILAVVYQDERPDRSLVPTATDELWDLINACWSSQPDLRPDSKVATEALKRCTSNPVSFLSIDTSPAVSTHVACSPSDSKFATNKDGALSFGDHLTGEIQTIPDLPTDGCCCMRYSPDGSMLAIANRNSIQYDIQIREVVSWKSKFGVLPDSTQTLCTTLVFSPDGKWLAGASHLGQVRIWDTSTGRAVHTFKGALFNGDGILTLAFSTTSDRLAAGGHRDCEVLLWNMGRTVVQKRFGRERDQRNAFPARCLDINFLPSADNLIVGYSDGVIVIWDISKFQAIRTADFNNGWVNYVAFSLDCSMYASVLWDKSIRLVCVETGEAIGLPLTGHKDSVNCVCFTANGSRLISGSRDQTIRIWELPLDDARRARAS